MSQQSMEPRWRPFEELPADLALMIVDDILNEYREDIEFGCDRGWQCLARCDCDYVRFQVCKDIANLARTCKGLYNLIIPVLYRKDTQWSHASALLLSAKNGSVAGVTKSLESGADVDQQDHTILEGYFRWIKRRLSDDFNMAHVSASLWYCKQTDVSFTALHWAVVYRHPHVVEVLLQRGADVNLGIDFGRRWSWADSYLDHDMFICRSLSLHPLMTKSFDRKGFPDMGMELYLELNDLLRKGQNALYCAFLDRSHSRSADEEYSQLRLPIVKLLVNGGCSLITYPAIGLHALHQACGNWSFEIADFLLSLDGVGVDPNVRDALGNTPMHYLVMGCLSRSMHEFPAALARLLVHRGADINATNHAGHLPLHYFQGWSGWDRDKSLPGNRKAALWLCRAGSHVFPGFIEKFRMDAWSCRDVESGREVNDVLSHAIRQKKINTTGLISHGERNEAELVAINRCLYNLRRHRLDDAGGTGIHGANAVMDTAEEVPHSTEVERWNSLDWRQYWAVEEQKLEDAQNA